MNCPKWFRCVVCVIVYNSQDKIFLGRRREGEAEGGKWAILGGSGAFGESDSRLDFARRELEYDVRIEVNPERLEPFTTIIHCNKESLVVEDYFFYREDGKMEVARNERAPAEGKWFSMEEIQRMNENGKIAFDNYKILSEFKDEL